MTPRAEWVERFAADLDALFPSAEPLGLAVSGGPDSLALLLLASAARPGAVEAASVDHALRDGSAAECDMVASLCARLAIPHSTLTIEWGAKPASNLQARARDQRYALLLAWADQRGLVAIATAHHADDQAETLLMRLAHGAGITGLSGVRPKRDLSSEVALIRPLLGWRREDLGRIVAEAQLTPVIDPANRDPRHDRTLVRRWLADSSWANPARLAAVAHHLGEADEALDWALGPLATSRIAEDGPTLTIDPVGIPPELQRRLLLAAFARSGVAPPRGPELARAIAALRLGRSVTLGALKLDGGSLWRVSPVPPRRAHCH